MTTYLRPNRMLPQSRSLTCRQKQRLFMFMTILAQTFFTFVGRHFMSFMLLTVWHSCIKNLIVNNYFKISAKASDGLNAGILCSGTMIDSFLVMLRATFCLRTFDANGHRNLACLRFRIFSNAFYGRYEVEAYFYTARRYSSCMRCPVVFNGRKATEPYY